MTIQKRFIKSADTSWIIPYRSNSVVTRKYCWLENIPHNQHKSNNKKKNKKPWRNTTNNRNWYRMSYHFRNHTAFTRKLFLAPLNECYHPPRYLTNKTVNTQPIINHQITSMGVCPILSLRSGHWSHFSHKTSLSSNLIWLR